MTKKKRRARKNRQLRNKIGTRPSRLLVGLGNPGPKYAATRHNFGFLLLDRVSELLQGKDDWTPLGSEEVAGLGRWDRYRQTDLDGHLLRPLTFMNRSGVAVEKVLPAMEGEEFSTRRDILVVIDDLSLPLGRLRIRPKGSAGGHNGLKSVEAHLGHSEYSRLKLGIGHPGEHSVVDYVLEPFDSEEKAVVNQVLDFAAPQALRWLEGAEVGELSQVMNGWEVGALSVEECEVSE